ncbi:PQQ-binding-like beta-propeller repeat protein [Streptomyces sp. NPDC090108]|uniref:protein kinase domain-containing protein n=1 Tax=Streptomyces sp. NPDC090108 TaxID=3365947 RepID=UPI0037F77612
MAPQRNTGPDTEAELPEYAGLYRLESQLGSGGMGVVHLARSASGLKLAVKVVHAEFARDPEFRGRFRQEVAAARRVSGAFTAPVVDADPEADRPWMATLFIPGATLAEEVKRNGSMNAAQLRRLMAGLAEALRDIHRVGVVHRDLKPSNVLLAENGPKVIDFGISRPADSELRTETGKLIGTPPFMAPEQFRRPREVGPAADIFALGSVIVHAATGRGPFDSDSPYVVAYQVVHDEPDLSGVPDGLAPLVLRCLAKEPEDRPTPDELMRELRSVAASYDTQAFIPAQRSGDTPPPERPRTPEPGKRAVRRPRGRTVLAGTAAVLAVGGLVASVHWTGTDRVARSEAHPRPVAAGFTAWRKAPAGEDGGAPRCAFGTGKLLCTGPGQVFALDPRDGAVLWRRAFAGARWSGTPVLSGGLVQVRDQNGHVRALDPDSGVTRRQQDLGTDTAARYTPNMLLLTREDGRVTGVDSASGRTRWSARPPGHGRPRVDSFPTDPLAYLTSAADDGRSTDVSAIDPGSGAVRWSTRLKGVLVPVGAGNGAVSFLDLDPVYGDTRAVVRYSAGSGTTRRVPLPAPNHDSRATVRGDLVFVLGSDGALDAVDTGADKPLWHLETSASRGSEPVADDRHVYFSVADGRLLAVDLRRGGFAGQTPPRPRARAGQVATDVPAPVLGQDHVYATAPDGTVSGVDARDPSAW